jgi:hypothetical protein
MALKFRVKSREELPAEHAQLYVSSPDGSGFVLDVDGAVEKARLDRARQVFKVVDGELRPVGKDGKSAVTGADGVSPISFEEWVNRQMSEAPHLFEPSVGGGAGGGSQSLLTSSATGRNPFKKESWNLTEQMRLQKTNPTLAARLRASAG